MKNYILFFLFINFSILSNLQAGPCQSKTAVEPIKRTNSRHNRNVSSVDVQRFIKSVAEKIDTNLTDLDFYSDANQLFPSYKKWFDGRNRNDLKAYNKLKSEMVKKFKPKLCAMEVFKKLPFAENCPMEKAAEEILDGIIRNFLTGFVDDKCQFGIHRIIERIGDALSVKFRND